MQDAERKAEPSLLEALEADQEADHHSSGDPMQGGWDPGWGEIL